MTSRETHRALEHHRRESAIRAVLRRSSRECRRVIEGMSWAELTILARLELRDR